MPRSQRFAALALALLLPALARADTESPVADGAKVEKVAGGFKFTEGPAPDADGNVYFTDQPNDRIHKWSAADGKVTVFMEPCGRSNGLAFDKSGRLWACADEKNELWTIDVKTKEKTVVVKDFGGKLLNGPNDIWVRDDGSAFFTDPYYKRPYWKRGAPEQDKPGVYFLSAKGELSQADAGDLKQPNGIIGTPDGKTLYVADIGGNKTYRYDVAADGKLTNRKLFCEQGSDGMTIDEKGNVYLTGRGVTVYDAGGKKVASIDVPEPWTANVCFGGKDMKTLFVTASTGFYAIPMKVKGAARQ
jgi:gluconolactonase